MNMKKTVFDSIVIDESEKQRALNNIVALIEDTNSLGKLKPEYAKVIDRLIKNRVIVPGTSPDGEAWDNTFSVLEAALNLSQAESRNLRDHTLRELFVRFPKQMNAMRWLPDYRKNTLSRILQGLDIK